MEKQQKDPPTKIISSNQETFLAALYESQKSKGRKGPSREGNASRKSYTTVTERRKGESEYFASSSLNEEVRSTMLSTKRRSQGPDNRVGGRHELLPLDAW